MYPEKLVTSKIENQLQNTHRYLYVRLNINIQKEEPAEGSNDGGRLCKIYNANHFRIISTTFLGIEY